MRPAGHSLPDPRGSRPHARDRSTRFAGRWFPLAIWGSGLLALGWLLLRSGSKPSRLAYPCQQTAFSAVALAFGTPMAAAALGLRRRLSPRAIVVVGIVLVATLGVWGYLFRPTAYAGSAMLPPADYRAEVFYKFDCAQDPLGDHFPGLDDLLEIMGGHGLKFYRSPTTSLVAGPDGVVGADDVVVIKINYQWDQRGGTNTDVLRGLIRRIVDHPDGYTGEIVVGENAQFRSVEGFDRDANNAQDITLSPHDVVAHFQGQGHRVSHYDWTAVRSTSVGEYSSYDMNDGYVLYTLDPLLQGRVSYPKFETSYGTRVSLKHGVWDATTGYDRARLKFINLPVLKSHNAVYGATASVKNYMGVVTDALGTNSHAAVHYGILGALLGEIQPADLNILDCIWVNANPNDGPWTTYEGATRIDGLIASRDPVAADVWATKNVLIPAFISNGYSPPWSAPSADPDDPSSAFRQYLDHSMDQILAAGYDVTNAPESIDATALAPPGEASDPTDPAAQLTLSKVSGGYELLWADPVRGGPVGEYNLYRVGLVGPGGAALPECEAYLGTATSATLSTLPDNHGFLVVGRNAVGDGSFGRGSEGHERPSPTVPEVCP